MSEWVKSKKYPGVRYRVHPTRKDGVESAKYICIVYKLDGKTKQETIGWSDRKWSEIVPDGKGGTKVVVHKINEKQAFMILSELQENQRHGRRPITLKEKREMAEQERLAIEIEAAKAQKENMPLKDAFEVYLGWAKTNKKDWGHDETRMNLHVLPFLGDKRLSEIRVADIEALKVRCQEKGLSPATVKHVLQCVRAVYNFCIRIGSYTGDNPTRYVKFPRLDNARKRFFSDDQVDALLSALAKKNTDVHDMTLLSILTGLRFGEIAKLRWERVDLENGIIHVDGKNGETREAYLDNEELVEMFTRRKEYFDTTSFVRKSVKSVRGLVFPGSVHGGIMKDIPDIFMKIVDDLKFNDGYEDARQKLTFHSCRHTFGSRLAQQGVPLLTIKELLGHKTIEMTMRYSHLMPDHKREAVRHLRGRKTAKVIPLRKIAE
ncbi:MAG: site-specific integrase [Proteobacteria bacterium]|nr:site-specific integrase [Pseudomonadota bacterium]